MPSVYHALVALAGLTCTIMCTLGWVVADDSQSLTQPSQVAVTLPTDPVQADAVQDIITDSTSQADAQPVANSESSQTELAADPSVTPAEAPLSEARASKPPAVAKPAKAVKSAKAVGQRRAAVPASRQMKRVYRVTAYCDQGTTASGRQSGVGQCAAPANIPFGSKVHIPALNRTLVVTDRTNKRFRHNTVDIFMSSEWACKQFGRNYLECEITLPSKDR